MRLSDSQLRFLAHFATTPDGQALANLLQERLVERDSKLRTATGEEVLRAQGRALELAELIGEITQAQLKLGRSLPTPSSAFQRAA